MKDIPKKYLLDMLEMQLKASAALSNRDVSLPTFNHQLMQNSSLALECLYFIVQNENDGSEHQRLSDAVSEFLHEFAPSEHGDMPGIMLNLAQDVRDGKR